MSLVDAVPRLHENLRDAGCSKLSAVKPSSLEFLANSGNVKLDALVAWLGGSAPPFTAANVVTNHFTRKELEMCAQLRASGKFLGQAALSGEELAEWSTNRAVRDEAGRLGTLVDVLKSHKDALQKQIEELNNMLGKRSEVSPAAAVVGRGEGVGAFESAVDALQRTVTAALTRLRRQHPMEVSDASSAGLRDGGRAPIPWLSQFDLDAYLRADQAYLQALQSVRGHQIAHTTP